MKRLILEVVQPSGRVSREDVTDTTPLSRIGQFFFPQGVAGKFGQIVRLEMTYSDGHVRTYYVEED